MASSSSSSSVKMRLVRGRYVFTGDRVIEHGAIVIEQGGTIRAVGSYDTLREDYPDAEKLLDNHDFWIIPGLINAHHHSNGVSNLLQGVDDDFLEPWLLKIIHTMRTQDPKLRTLLSSARLLQTGVTSVVDMAHVGGGNIKDCMGSMKACLDAYETTGMRVAFCPGESFQSHLVHNEDEAFLDSLPLELREKTKGLMAPGITPEEYITMVTELVQTYQGHEKIDVWFGPPGPQWVGDDVLVKIVQAAKEQKTQIQTHAVESFYEKLLGPRFHEGKSVLQHLNDLGCLSPQFSIAHGTWVSRADIKLLAQSGATISHNPSSNLRLRAGVAPLNAMLAGNVTLGLGMDGTTLGDDEDMFAEMRLAARLHRTPQLDTPAPSYERIFEMATTGGASLMGKADLIGKLEPGYQADLVMLKADRFTWPWMAPGAIPLHVLLLRAKAIDVDTVIVGGNIVLQRGLPTKFDMAAVGQALALELNAQQETKEVSALVAELKPHLTRWYSNWEHPSLESYAAFNSQT
jgi:cytosine/adenosine deaminase-related metal-dependent hydrolase